MYLKGSKWSMNRRRQHFNWFRILVLTLLIAAGLYLNRFVIPAAPSLFEATPTATRPPEAYLTEAEELFNQGKLNQAIQALTSRPSPSTRVMPASTYRWHRCRSLPATIHAAQASAENALLLSPNNSMAHASTRLGAGFPG